MMDFAFTKDSDVISRSFTASVPTIAGYLLKQNSSGRRNFAKRWFALHAHCLSYYQAEPAYWQAQQPPCGMLDLRHVVATFVNERTITLQLTVQAARARGLAKDHFCLPISRKSSTSNAYVLIAKSQRQAKLWFDAICTVTGASTTTTAAAAVVDGGSSCETSSTTLSTPPWPSSSFSRRLVPRVETLQVGGVSFGEEECLHLRDERKVLLVPHAFNNINNKMTVTLTNGASETKDFAPLQSETHGIVRLLGLNQTRVSVYWKRRRLQQSETITTAMKEMFSTLLMLYMFWNPDFEVILVLMVVGAVLSRAKKCGNEDDLVITHVSVKRNSTSTSLRNVSERSS